MHFFPYSDNGRYNRIISQTKKDQVDRGLIGIINGKTPHIY